MSDSNGDHALGRLLREMQAVRHRLDSLQAVSHSDIEELRRQVQVLSDDADAVRRWRRFLRSPTVRWSGIGSAAVILLSAIGTVIAAGVVVKRADEGVTEMKPVVGRLETTSAENTTAIRGIEARLDRLAGAVASTADAQGAQAEATAGLSGQLQGITLMLGRGRGSSQAMTDAAERTEDAVQRVRKAAGRARDAAQGVKP